jgi:hypothetical protein
MNDHAVKVICVRFMRRVSTILVCAAACVLFQVATAPNALAEPILGSNLSTFAVLGSSTVTNSGPTTLTGSLGVSPGSAITGFFGTTENDGPGTINSGTGAVHQTDAYANTAQNQLGTAITALEGMSSGAANIPGGILGGKTLGPGVYTTSPSDTLTMGLTGTLNLDGGGNANALWVFLVHSSLTTASSSVVNVYGTGEGAGVYWVMETGSATLGSSSTFEGNILSYASITAVTSATDSCGRLLAQTGAVTLDTNTVGIGGCSAALTGSSGLSGGGTLSLGPNGGPVITPLALSGVPEPGTFMLFGAGIACLAAWRRASARGRQRDLASKT